LKLFPLPSVIQHSTAGSQLQRWRQHTCSPLPANQPTCVCQRWRVLWQRLGGGVIQKLSVDGKIVQQIKDAGLRCRVPSQHKRLLQQARHSGGSSRHIKHAAGDSQACTAAAVECTGW
jgi:hypothetical protein